MDAESREFLDEAECDALFDPLFPAGFGGPDVLAALAPEGWEQSPLLAAFHPSAERRYEEALQLHRNLERFPFRPKEGAPPPLPPPTLDEVRASHREKPVDARAEAAELVALCLWDIFSDNHHVIAPDGREVALGSFRGAAGFLAERLGGGADYKNVYMGTIWIAGRADLTPVYEMLFRRMKAAGLDWIYEHPRLGLVHLDLPEEAPMEEYDPSAALAEEEKEREREEALARLEEELDEAHREARAEARRRPPPATVRAYRAVHGRFPRGWPP